MTTASVFTPVTRVLALSLLAAFGIVSLAQAVETAADEPAALAASYAKQAVELRADAAKHARIAQVHRAGAGGPKAAHVRIAAHCERIAASLSAAADESEALAETYRGLAKEQ